MIEDTASKTRENVLISVIFNVFICKIIIKPSLYRAKKMVVKINGTECSGIYYLLVFYLGLFKVTLSFPSFSISKGLRRNPTIKIDGGDVK